VKKFLNVDVFNGTVVGGALVLAVVKNDQTTWTTVGLILAFEAVVYGVTALRPYLVRRRRAAKGWRR
jgi:hypothetical protein